jgi:hypothetical protein
MGKKKVFVSYDHSEDLKYKDMLRAWDANTEFDFEFDQRSPNKAIDSEDAGPIKTALTKKMLESDYLLVIVGAKAYSSKWMKWEIDRAKQLDTKLKLAAVKIELGNTLPTGISTSNTAIVSGFTLINITSVLAKAQNSY